jgi:hypothetical protein
MQSLRANFGRSRRGVAASQRRAQFLLDFIEAENSMGLTRRAEVRWRCQDWNTVVNEIDEARKAFDSSEGRRGPQC